MLLHVEFKEMQQLIPAEFKEMQQLIPTEFKNTQVVHDKLDIELYTGSYDITPKINAQTLNTANKYMTEDVSVRAIPFYSVDNVQKGQTIIIGAD